MKRVGQYFIGYGIALSWIFFVFGPIAFIFEIENVALRVVVFILFIAILLPYIYFSGLLLNRWKIWLGSPEDP